MKKLLVSILTLTLLVGTAVAGRIERGLERDGYTEAVYTVLAEFESRGLIGKEFGKTEYARGQCFAIGPTYVITARHVVVMPGYTLKRIMIVTKDIVKGDYIAYAAQLVRAGPWNMDKRFDDDWAVLHVSKPLKHWKAVDLATDSVKVGDKLYNISINFTTIPCIFPMIVVATSMKLYALPNDSKSLTYGEGAAWDVYLLSPPTVGGDSGSPIFNKKGELVGIVVGGNDKLAAATKSSHFARAIRDLRGK